MSPLIYVFSEQRNPTQLRIIGPGKWNAEIYQNGVEDFEEEHVKLAVYSRTRIEIWQYVALPHNCGCAHTKVF